jgi:hypothetical protein
LELSFTDHSLALGHGDDVKVGAHNLINNCVALLSHVYLEKGMAFNGLSIVRVVGKNQLSFTDHSLALECGDEGGLVSVFLVCDAFARAEDGDGGEKHIYQAMMINAIILIAKTSLTLIILLLLLCKNINN